VEGDSVVVSFERDLTVWAAGVVVDPSAVADLAGNPGRGAVRIG
jgi:hypothetical protein